VVGARAELEDEKHAYWLKEHAWELVPLVGEYITEGNEEAGPHLTLCCQDLLLLIAEKGNAKENLIAFLEQIDGFSGVKVRRCLPGLAKVLSKIKDKSKALSWSWALDTLYSQVKLLQVPDNAGLEGEERLAIDLGEVAVEVTEMMEDIVTFLEPLVALVSIEVGPEPEDVEYVDVERRRRVLRLFMLQLLGRPLSFLNLHPEHKAGPKKDTQRLRPIQDDSSSKIEPAAFSSAKKLLKMIGAVSPNIVAQVVGMEKISHPNAGVLEEEDKLQPTSIGTFLYLDLGEGASSSCIPSVYSKLHLLHLSCPHILPLLQSTHEMCVHKGLILLQSLLESIPTGSLSPLQSEDPAHLSLVAPLVHVCVYHDLLEMRTLAFLCYRIFISIFSVKARYKVFRFIFNTVTHSGLLGWTITQLKDAVNCSVSRSGDNKGVLVDVDDLDEFRGDSFVRLVKGFLVLKEAEKTDLLDIYDQIIATINMFVYLLQVDRNNLTGVVDLKVDLKRFVEQLEEALRLSRAHYQLKLAEIGGKKKEVDCSVVVGGKELGEMPENQQKNVINGALTTFDMIQYNLVRLTELVENTK